MRGGNLPGIRRDGDPAPYRRRFTSLYGSEGSRTMETTDKGMLGEWQHLLNHVMVNAADLPHLEAPRVKLAAQLARAQEINQQQDALTASKQEASKQFRLV